MWTGVGLVWMASVEFKVEGNRGALKFKLFRRADAFEIGRSM